MGNMSVQKIEARRHLHIAYSPPEVDRYIEVVNKLSLRHLGTELDSLDAGDATGALFPIFEREAEEGIFIHVESPGNLDPFILTVTYEDDLFEYDPDLRYQWSAGI